MKKQFYKRWSRHLLLTLLAVIVGGVSPAWAQKALPYSYGFEDNNLATDGWTALNPSGLNSSEFGIVDAAKKTGSYGFRFSSYNENGESTQYLISPVLNAPTGVDLTFAYAASSSSGQETFKVGYSTTNTDIASFIFDGPEYKATSMSWSTFEGSFPAGTKYIAVYYYANFKYRLFVDDFTFSTPPTCITPTGLTTTDITSSSVKLSWTSDGDTWNVQYKKTADADWTDVSGNITSNPYTLSGLEPATAYQVRVRTYCDASDQSEWTDAVSFSTPQEAVSANSFSDDFEGSTNWLFVNGDLTNAWVIGSATNNGGSNALYISNDGGTTNAYSTGSSTMVYATKLFTFAVGKYDISYDWKCYGEGNYDYMRVAIVPASTTLTAGTAVLSGLSASGLPSVWIAIDGGSKLYNSSAWQTKSVEATIETAGDYMVVFAWRNDGSSGTQPAAAIDNFSIDLQACPKPTGVAISDVKATEATLGWDNVDDTTWEVYVSTESAKPAADVTVTGTADANTYQFTTLTAETTYYAWVRAVKGSDKSTWAGGVSFTTTAAGAVLNVSSDPIAFGLVASGSNDIIIKNEGAAQMTGVTVSYTATTGDANAITIGTVSATVDGNSQQTVTVSVNTAKLGAFSGTITVAATDQTSVEIPVSGYVLDGTKICETFASKPDHWTSSGTWTYSATNGAYGTSSSTTLTSPKIVVEKGETLTISAKQAYSGSYYYLKIEGSADNGSTWTAYTKQLNTASDPALSTTDFTIVTLSDIPTTVNKLRITAYYAYINALNGFTYDEDPQLALYSDEACTTTQAATAEKNWGFVTDAQQQKYYIKNTGNGTIDLTIEQADGFTAAVDDAALAEGEKATLTIDMAATEGLHNGTVTVTAKNHKTNEVLGTFAVTLNGAVAGSKKDINFVADALSELPAGWETTGWTVTNSSYVGVSGTASDLTSQIYTVASGETLLIEAKTTNLSWYTPELSYSYKVGDGDWSTATEMSGFANDYKVFAITGVPAGQVRVKFTGKYIQIRRIYGFEAASVPVMVFNAADKNFGMVTAATTSDAYTITNSGAGVLNGLSVTCDNANFEIAVADNATSIAANGGTATFTVKLKNDTKGLHEGTVTVAGTGVDSKTFAVKGYVADDTKIFTTFTALPDRWENTGNYWSFSASGATATSSSSKLATPKIKITEGEKLAISAMQRYSGSSYYVTINGSSDNGATWTAYTKTLNNTQLNNTDYTVVELNDIPTTVNKLQLVGYYVYVNGFNGFTYDDNDPALGVFSNSECTTAISEATVTNAWGFVNEDKTATYYIKNTGTGTMTLSKTDAPAGFTATLGATSLGAGESTSLIIAMANDATNNEGYHAGDVVLTAKDNADNTLGTFTVTSSGVVVGSKTDVNFTTLSALPAGWETTTWTVTANEKATVGYSTGTLTTGTYSVAAGEKMVVLAKKNSSYGTLSYKVSTDGGASWSAATTITPSSTSEYELKVIEGIAAGDNVKIEFTGYYADIQRIYGFTAVAKPAMTLSPAAASYDFGMQTTATNYVITVTNSGTADMENLAAALTGDDADDFEVAVSKTTVPYTGENTATITVTMKASTEYATHNATLTISADGLADKVITLSGKTRDASKWFVDFASEIPSSFVETDDWTVSSGTARTTSSTENSLTTQPINLAAGEKIYFDAYNPYSGSLKVRYSLNGGLSWSDYTDYTASINTSGSTFSSHEIDLGNEDAVTAVVEFTGRYYIQLDNIYGGTLNNTASMMKVTKGTAVVGNGSTEAFGSIKAEATATYTITNPGNGTLTITSPVTVTGVATATVSATSLANGESATLTITMPVEAPYEYKEGVVTVATSLGDFVINYNATILNPNALDEQFASGKPAGWYFGGYWEVSSQRAENNASGVADLITEQLTVAGTTDVLTFQAARTSSSSAPTFNVYTSQDRVTWNEIDLSSLTLTTSYQDVNISGLAAGDYYVKISGARVKVDNFLGWTKKNNTRDLYVTATNIPTALTASYTATATVTSLIAAETGVYAKLFFGDNEIATATTADVALNGSTTFTMTTDNAPTDGFYKAKVVVYYSDGTVAFTTGTTNVGTLVLNDTEDFVAANYVGSVFSVKINRSFNAGWGTVVLPFSVNSYNVSTYFGDDTKLYTLKSYDSTTGEITFTSASSIEAGKPYLINIPAALAEGITFTDVTITSAVNNQENVDGAAFKGNYEAAMSMDGKYGVTPSGTMAQGTSGSTMKAFRSYIELPAGGSPARLVIYDESTGISHVLTADEVENLNIYNLNGQRVDRNAKGIIIVNGRKVMK